ncbi:MAG: peptide-methionine (S)-S-oxide reductase MsrA [Bacteroidota bacterium]
MASGCFWGREYHFRQLPGVISARTGFVGGKAVAPTYQQVCSENTGHAETVEVVYDLRKLTTEALLVEFFTLHDFTEDRSEDGGQYRSAIFLPRHEPHGLAQEKVALKMLATLREEGMIPTTQLRWEEHFYPADSRHQQYCSTRGIVPKKREMEAVREILTFK